MATDILDHRGPEPDTLPGFRLFRAVATIGPAALGVAFLSVGATRLFGFPLLSGLGAAASFFAIGLFAWLYIRRAVSRWLVAVEVDDDGIRLARRSGEVLECRWTDRSLNCLIYHVPERRQHKPGIWISLRNSAGFATDRITEAGLGLLREKAGAFGLRFDPQPLSKHSAADWKVWLVQADVSTGAGNVTK